MNKQNPSDFVLLLEDKIGLESGFFESLDADDESDWSFVIKIHALVEAATSHLLTEHLGRSELNGLFSRLDMSNKTTGKAAFVEALGLLDKPARRFISSLSELRNKLVHDVRSVNFDLKNHVEGLRTKDRDLFVKNFNLLSTDVTDDVRNLFFHDPRQALWYASMGFLRLVYLKLEPTAH